MSKVDELTVFEKALGFIFKAILLPLALSCFFFGAAVTVAKLGLSGGVAFMEAVLDWSEHDQG